MTKKPIAPPSKPRPPTPREKAPDRLVAYSWLKGQVHALPLRLDEPFDASNTIEAARNLRLGASAGDDVVCYVREDMTKLQAAALHGQTVDFVKDGDMHGLRALYGLPRLAGIGTFAAYGMLLDALQTVIQAGLESSDPVALKKALEGALFLLKNVVRVR